jgi:hypothetical protein
MNEVPGQRTPRGQTRPNQAFAGAAASRGDAQQTLLSPKTLLLAGGILAVGVVAVAGGINLLGNHNGEKRLDAVPAAYVQQVEGTLDPSQATQLAEEASQCRAPLARVAVWHEAGAPDGAVSLVSGTYHSPSFTIQTTPHVIAIPFPAAYSVGKGVISVLGQGSDVHIKLYPTVLDSQLGGKLDISVWWDPAKGGCP